MKKQNSRTAGGFSPAETEKEKTLCEGIDSRALEQEGSDVAINLAISLAISPTTDENYKTESDGDKSSNKSSYQPTKKPNCYKCKYRRSLVDSAHSECRNNHIDEVDRMMSILYATSGFRSSAMKELDISLNWHGVKNGWAYWPINYDPIWLESCNGFSEVE